MLTQDGLMTVVQRSSGGLVSVCEGLLKLTSHPLCAAHLSADGGSVALAWPDRLLVVEAPWEEAKLEVLATYLCPQVRLLFSRRCYYLFDDLSWRCWPHTCDPRSGASCDWTSYFC